MLSSAIPALDLPPPDARAAADSDELAARVREACAAAGGAIGFDAYMELALYAPGLGYYSAARQRFGAGGDFVTAPEISPRFARCVARQVAELLSASGGGAVLEAGAGSGALAAGVLDELDALGHGDVGYLVLERSASARELQRERLGARAQRVRWIDDFPAAGFEGVVLANELLDAIPAQRFAVRAGEPIELGVRPRGDGFEWTPLADGARLRGLRERLADLEPLADGYVFEFGPAREAWVREAGARLARGALLLFDYGYPRRELYHPQRGDGTLACHYRHRVHADPFVLPGLQDISVHVDFTGVAEAGAAAGLELAGYTTQAHFLVATGVLDGLDDPALGERERIELTGQIHRLTLPAEMGEAVKVIALARGVPGRPCGFAVHDLGHRL